MLVQLRRKLRTLGGKWQCLVVSLDVDREMMRANLQADSIQCPIIATVKPLSRPLSSNSVCTMCPRSCSSTSKAASYSAM